MENSEKIKAAVSLALGVKADPFKPVKDFLYQVRDAKRGVDMIERRIEFREEAIGAHGVSYSEYLPGGNDFNHSSVEDAVMALDLLSRELQDAESAYTDAKVTVSELIAKLPDVNHQVIITKKYIDGMDWEKIALDMGMNVRTVQKHHGRALPLLLEELESAA